MKKKGLSEAKLKMLLGKWQKKMKLNGWKISIRIVEFKRKDYRQSGDIKVYPRKKQAVILLTCDPFRNEERVMVHELVHLLLWDFDIFAEKQVLKTSGKFRGSHGRYMFKLEETVEKLTSILFD